MQQTLGCQGKNVGPELLDQLLCCATFLTSYEEGWWSYLSFRPFRVLPEVLRQGGNPNRDFFTRTIWREFLERTLFEWHKSHKRSARLEFTPDAWAAITVTTVAFVEYGADVQAIWTFHFSSVMTFYYLDSQASPEDETVFSTCSFDIQLSPLSAIHLCLRDRPQFPRIREMCISRGAVSYSRCTILEVSFSSREESAEYRKQYELSEHESEDFLALFENYMEDCNTNDGPVMGDLRRQILKFYHRLDEVRPPSSSSRTNVYDGSFHFGGIDEGESKWSTYTSRFQSGTLGLKVSRAAESQKEYEDARTLQSHPYDSDSESEAVTQSSHSGRSSLSVPSLASANLDDA